MLYYGCGTVIWGSRHLLFGPILSLWGGSYIESTWPKWPVPYNLITIRNMRIQPYNFLVHRWCCLQQTGLILIPLYWPSPSAASSWWRSVTTQSKSLAKVQRRTFCNIAPRHLHSPCSWWWWEIMTIDELMYSIPHKIWTFGAGQSRLKARPAHMNCRPVSSSDKTRQDNFPQVLHIAIFCMLFLRRFGGGQSGT